MDDLVCPLCQKRISDWMIAGGKCVTIGKHMYHTSCIKTVKETEEKDDQG